MAIWQVVLDFIPEKGLIKVLGKVPNKLPRKYLDRQRLSNLNLEDCEEPLAPFWKDITRGDFSKLIVELSERLPEIDWLKDSTDIYSWGNSDSNDLTLSLDDKDVIESINCRIDLRDIDEDFIDLVLKVSDNYNLLLSDSNGNLIKPDRLALGKLIANTNPANFVADPEKFINDFVNGKRKPE